MRASTISYFFGIGFGDPARGAAVQDRAHRRLPCEEVIVVVVVSKQAAVVAREPRSDRGGFRYRLSVRVLSLGFLCIAVFFVLLQIIVLLDVKFRRSCS